MPSDSRVLILYSTSACHLCEQAISLLNNMPEATEFTVVIKDISDSEELMERFDVRIPVILAEGQTRDLGWPFNAEDVKQYLYNEGLREVCSNQGK